MKHKGTHVGGYVDTLPENIRNRLFAAAREIDRINREIEARNYVVLPGEREAFNAARRMFYGLEWYEIEAIQKAVKNEKSA